MADGQWIYHKEQIPTQRTQRTNTKNTRNKYKEHKEQIQRTQGINIKHMGVPPRKIIAVVKSVFKKKISKAWKIHKSGKLPQIAKVFSDESCKCPGWGFEQCGYIVRGWGETNSVLADLRHFNISFYADPSPALVGNNRVYRGWGMLVSSHLSLLYYTLSYYLPELVMCRPGIKTIVLCWPGT